MKTKICDAKNFVQILACVVAFLRALSLAVVRLCSFT